MRIKQPLKLFILALIGGSLYVLIELAWRGHSHISMFILGAICFVLLGEINEYISWELGLFWQMLIGAGIITVFELTVGLIVNKWLKLEVWDYSNLQFNFMGQICLQFSLAWILISGVAIILDDYLRYWMFGEETPHYKLV